MGQKINPIGFRIQMNRTWDSRWFANKQSHSDLLMRAIVVRRELWLIGTDTTEVWTNTGAPDFPFGEMAGVFVDR